jgi:hypothetical protein
MHKIEKKIDFKVYLTKKKFDFDLTQFVKHHTSLTSRISNSIVSATSKFVPPLTSNQLATVS